MKGCFEANNIVSKNLHILMRCFSIQLLITLKGRVFNNVRIL